MKYFIGGPIVIDPAVLADFRTEIFGDTPDTLEGLLTEENRPHLRNLVARTSLTFEDSLLARAKTALQFLPAYSPWMTTAFRQEFESARGASSSISVLLFKSGSMSATGASSLLSILLQMTLMVHELEFLTGSRVYCKWKGSVLKSDLIVSETILPWPISRALVATGPCTTWRPHVFPGAFIKVPYAHTDGDVSVLVYDDRFIVAGTKTWEAACTVSAYMLWYLSRFRTDVPAAPPAKRRRR